MAYETVLVTKKDLITTVTLNRPNAKNAMNPRMHREMRAVMAEIESDDDCRVVIVTGSGDSFSAGMDLKEYFEQTDVDTKARAAVRKDAFEWLYRQLRLLPIPTIAAVNGWCFGGGFLILGCCDFAIASEDAVFGLSEVNWGIIPAGGASKVVSMLMAPRDALYTIMTGKTFTGKEASAMRLVNSAVPADKLMSAAIELANELKKKNRTTLAYCKEVFRTEQHLPLDEAVAWENAKWQELDWMEKKLWKQGLHQFKDEKSFRPGLETADWKK